MRHNPDGTTTLTPYEAGACTCPAVGRVFGVAQALAWSGALAAAGAFWLRSRPGRGNARATLGLQLAAGVLLAAAPIYLALMLPAAFLADGERVYNVVPIGRWGASFFGSHAENVAQNTAWGPGSGWYLALVAGTLTLAARTRPPRSAQAEAAVPAPVPAPLPHAIPHPAEAAARENAFVPPPG